MQKVFKKATNDAMDDILVAWIEEGSYSLRGKNGKAVLLDSTRVMTLLELGLAGQIRV